MKLTPIKCDKCGYKWETESKMIYVSCPSCIQKVKIPMKDESPQNH